MSLNSTSEDQLEPTLIQAHRHSIRNRDELLGSDLCGCFYCLATFAPSAIQTWVNERDETSQTALCPYCGIDSVIGSQSGYPISREFLAEMEKQWFGLRSDSKP